MILERIGPDHISLYKTIRLRALRDTPSAFGSTYERESSFSDAEWATRLTRMAGDDGVGFLAMDNGQPCGLVGGVASSEDPGTVTLVSMWVAPTHRRAGIGRALVDAVLDWARDRNASAVVLMVTSNNSGAMALYARAGFVRTGRIKPHPHQPTLTEFEMRRLFDPTDSESDLPQCC